MTKEDILHHFQDINFYYGDCMMYADLSGMLDELIAENKGDLISRQAVEEINSEIPKIHELLDIAYEYNQEDSTRTELSQKCTTYLLDVWQTLGAIVDNYPPVENKGEWIERRNKATGHIESVCSVCGAEESYPYNLFCPNCGADMRGE